MRRSPLLILSLLAGAATAAAGQAPLRLGLADALARAREHHPGLIDARMGAAVRTAQADASRAAFLPQVSVDWGLIRTDDPVAVFGSKLRQGVFAAPDLALDALNSPAAVTNTSVGVTVEQPLVMPEAWLGRRAALAGAEAGRRFEARAEQLTALDVIQAYFGARLALERVAVMDTSLAAARRTLEQVRAFRREGLVTAVDEQLALAKVSELEAGRAMADADRVGSSDRLLVLLGETPGTRVELVDRLDDAVPASPGGETTREDLAGLEAVVRAQQAGLDRARAQWIPSVGAFGSLNWNQGNFGALAGPRRWTAGVMVRWNLFRGFADVADLNRARAERDAAEQRLDAARRQAEAEVRADSARVAASAVALDAANRALTHAEEAVRVSEARYAGGVGTISELLAVRAAESGQRLARLDALHRARIARAALVVAKGGMPE